MADAEVVSLQISLPQMLDLALGTPEVGAVNFNILHNFLHILLYRANLGSVKVEYRGDDANRLKRVVTSQKPSPSLYLQEYNITDGSGQSTQRSANEGAATADVLTNDPNSRTSAGITQAIGPGQEGEQQKVIYVEPIIDGAAPTALGFKKLEGSVNELQQRFQALEGLATNPELVERLKGKITDPISDVWQVINITKRLDASEEGIDKLTSMIQDVIKGGQIASSGSSAPPSNAEARLTTLETNVSEMEETIKNIQVLASTGEEELLPMSGSLRKAGESAANIAGSPSIDKSPSVSQSQSGQAGRTSQKLSSVAKRVSLNQLLGGVNLQEMSGDVTALKTEVSLLREDMDDVRSRLSICQQLQKGKKPDSKPSSARADSESASQAIKRERVTYEQLSDTQQDSEASSNEQNIKKERVSQKPSSVKQESLSRERLPKQGTSQQNWQAESERSTINPEVQSAQPNQAMQKLDERIGKLEQEIASLADKVNNASATVQAGGTELSELASKVQGIEGEVGKLSEMTDHLVDERDNRDINLNAVLEQVELLKTIKADKEDLEDALADKADAHAIHRKVSHDQFDAACDDLARGLEEAINKLGKQEMIWQQALDEVQREIEGKVDKMEMTPLREFVSTRLKSLQEKLWNIAEMRQENEAAGSKKLLKDVQCLSCDKNVVMRTEESGKYRADTMPCNVSLKPYLTYELDQVRKQQRRLPHSRNMIQFEAALQEETRRQRSQKGDGFDKTLRDHLCNRYCGGSHTVITPHQRVTRPGHFLDQWGPDIVQLTEGVVKGSDGKMYRGRPVKFDSVCGPQNCATTSEEKVQPTVTERASSATPRPRKSYETRRSSAEPRRRSSSTRSSTRKSSAELPTVPLKEMMDDARIRPLEHMDEDEEEEEEEVPTVCGDPTTEDDVLPIDPLDNPDEVIRYDDDDEETDMENDENEDNDNA